MSFLVTPAHGTVNAVRLANNPQVQRSAFLMALTSSRNKREVYRPVGELARQALNLLLGGDAGHDVRCSCPVLFAALCWGATVGSTWERFENVALLRSILAL